MQVTCSGVCGERRGVGEFDGAYPGSNRSVKEVPRSRPRVGLLDEQVTVLRVRKHLHFTALIVEDQRIQSADEIHSDDDGGRALQIP
jgi:hypothetical protein